MQLLISSMFLFHIIPFFIFKMNLEILEVKMKEPGWSWTSSVSVVGRSPGAFEAAAGTYLGDFRPPHTRRHAVSRSSGSDANGTG